MNRSIYESATLALQMTSCTQKCKHCFIPKNRSGSMSVDMIEDILYDYSHLASKLNNPIDARLYIFDEPTTHPEIVRILRYARAHGIKYMPLLSTNCTGLKNREKAIDVLSEFKGSGVKAINVSLFGREEYHDWFTGRDGAWEDIWRGVELARDMGYQIKWNLFLTNENQSDIVHLEKTISDDWKSVSIPFTSGNWRKQDKLAVHLHDLDNLPTRLRKVLRRGYKTEAEWKYLCSVDRICNNEYRAQLFENTGNKRLHIRDGYVYDHVWDNSAFQIGKIGSMSLHEYFLAENASSGMSLLRNIDIATLANMYGESDANGKLDRLTSIVHEWLFRSGQL